MVYFTCNTCGSSIKKNQVEKHCKVQCRNCRVLSCIDCGKDFIGEAYKEHTQCITEAEKYSAKGWQPKTSQSARGKRQQAWLMAVKAVACENKDADPKVRKFLQFLSEQESIPRKKSKLENFLRNKNEKTTQEIIDEVWNLLSLAQEKLKDNVESRNLTETVSDDFPEAEDTTTTQEGGKPSKKERKAERKRKQMKVEKKDVKMEKNDEEEEREKKKKKHKHRQDVAADDEAEQKGEDVVQDKKKRKHEEGEEGSNKKKKRNHYEETEGARMNGEEGQAEEEHKGEGCHENDNRRKKKRKSCDEDIINEGEESRKKKTHEERIEDSGKKKGKQQQGEEDVKQEAESCMQESNSGDVRVGSAKKFKWESVIKTILQSKDGEISLKKLRKKAIAEYCARGGDGKGEKSMENLWALFNKKVNKNPNFKVLKDKVKLVK